MASIHTKTERLSVEAYVASGKVNHVSNKHYKVQHHALQKQYHLYDNDWIDTYMMEDESGNQDLSTGTSRKSWRIHEADGFDDYKDCN